MLNQLLEKEINKEFPMKKPMCPCNFRCERLGGTEGDCDNCSYCNSDGGTTEPQTHLYGGEQR